MSTKMKSNSFLIAISAVALGLIAGGLLMVAIGSNPFEGFYFLFRGGLMSLERVGNTVATAITLMLVGLSVAFAFKTGLFNIGASGQMLIGGLAATLVAHYVFLPRIIFLPVMIIAAFLGGAIWGIIPGFLKAKFNVHEVVATIKAEKPAVVFAPHVETSAGIILPQDYLQAVGDAVHSVGGLFVLDCIASGTIWVDMEANNVDVLISAPQKGWSGPPCAGLVMMSDLALARLEETTSSSFAMNLKQ